VQTVKPELEEELKELETQKAKALYMQDWARVATAQRNIRALKKKISQLKQCLFSFAEKNKRDILTKACPLTAEAPPCRLPCSPVFCDHSKPLGILDAMMHGFFWCNDCGAKTSIEDPDKRRCARCGSHRVVFKHQ
jgi:DNA-directed RNA polymerase subunit RPC12/RpoP